MPASLDLHSLRAAYAAGADPVDTMRDVLARIEAAGDDHVWISRVPGETVLAQAAALRDRSLPLFGIPFAVKDNIDLLGLPTTAACPAFAQTPERTAPIVQRLMDAGAIPIGNTNLDQFATGLVGVRSPYGTPRNPFDPLMVPGGSSSGSAVAVSSGLVSFALGTDTAGSGRVPAGFNNIVGLKPTRGWLSTTGVVPACRSMDCVSVFALTAADALAVAEVAGAYDLADPYSRLRQAAPPTGLRFGVPSAPEFFGDAEAEAAYDAACRRLEALGGVAVPFDFGPFAETAALLYGPWAAERLATLEPMLAQPDALHPAIRTILEGARAVSGADLFRAQHRLAMLRRSTDAVWETLDLLLLPTSPTAYSCAALVADPIRLNSNLGTYTNFANLLDLSAIAVPAGFYASGFPIGVTLVGRAWQDRPLAALADRLHRTIPATMGATGHGLPDNPVTPGPAGTEIAVFGAHLTGQPLNPALAALGGRFVRACRTAPAYRMLALPGTPARPALLRDAHGVAIEGEVWAIPPANLAAFLATIAPPLGLGTVELDHGPALGFIAEAGAAGTDITHHGGWRAYLAA